jgi:hypothetical protein
MGNRKWKRRPIPGIRGGSLWPLFLILLCLNFAVSLFAGGCASPGDPNVRRPPTPQPVTDLAASREGNDVILAFTLPKETTGHRLLEQPPAITIYRDFEPATSNASDHPTAPESPTRLVTIPAAMVPNYSVQGHVRYGDRLRADDFAKHTGMVAVYTLETSLSKKAVSAISNAASVIVEPAADPIEDLKADSTRTGVKLEWTAPGRTLVPASATITGYRIYRGEAAESVVNAASDRGQTAGGSAPEGAAETAKVTPNPILTKIGETDSLSFTDTQTEFTHTYVYSVRSVVQDAGETVESGDSNLVVLARTDVFAPAAPEGLVIAAVPEQGDTPAHLELSWAISVDNEVAGYNIYRADKPGAAGSRLNNQLLLTPAFRDMNVQPGRAYFYSVTAVDRAGNESPQSGVVSGSVAAESQKTP